ncbi:hypothetical protein ACWGJ9_08385 [Curtobacterium citreum]
MTFNEHDHPRGTAGKFTEKQQSPDEVTLPAAKQTATYKHPHPSNTGEQDLAIRSGQRVTIVRPLGEDDGVDAEVGPMLRVRFADGHETDVFDDELSDRRTSTLTEPHGYDESWGPLTSAASVDGERLDENDGINARAEYAEVGEYGIAYGITVGPELIGSIVVGDRRDGEDEMDYFDRVDDALGEASITENQLFDYFTKRYGADARWDGDAGHIAVEFFVEYGDEGPAGTSIEAMGDRVENETKLLGARNDYDYGTAMQSHLADHLGYRTDPDTGEYVRDPEAAAASVVSEAAEHAALVAAIKRSQAR